MRGIIRARENLRDRLACQTHAVFNMPVGMGSIHVMIEAIRNSDGGGKVIIICTKAYELMWKVELTKAGIGPDRYHTMTAQYVMRHPHLTVFMDTDLLIVWLVPFRFRSRTHVALQEIAKQARRVWIRPSLHDSSFYPVPPITDHKYELVVMYPDGSLS